MELTKKLRDVPMSRWSRAVVGYEIHPKHSATRGRCTVGHLDAPHRGHHDAFVRTTLTLDPDVAQMLEEQAHRLHKPFKQVVNEAIRRGLAPRPSGAVPRYKVTPHEAGLQPGIDPGRLNALADDLAIAEPRRTPKRRASKR